MYAAPYVETVSAERLMILALPMVIDPVPSLTIITPLPLLSIVTALSVCRPKFPVRM